MPIEPPATIAAAPASPVAPPDVMMLTPRQVAEADWATQQRYATAQRALAEQAALAADQRVQDQRFMDALTQNARMQNAEKAVSAAMRFQGIRGFERDLSAAKAAGLSEEQATLQALTRNAGRMFADAPGDIAPSVRALQPPQAVPAANGIPAHIIAPPQRRPYFPPSESVVQPLPVTVEEIPGTGRKFVRTGPRSGQILPSDELSLNNKLRILEAKAQALADQSALASGTNKVELSKKLDAVMADMDKLMTPSAQPTDITSPGVTRPAPSGPASPQGAVPPSAAAPPRTGYVIVRRKSDNARLRYPAARLADLEGDDRYELVK